MNALEQSIDVLTRKAQDLTHFCNIVGNEEWNTSVLEMQEEIRAVNGLLAKARSTLTEHPMVMSQMRGALYELRRQEAIWKCVLDRTDTSVVQTQAQDGYMTPTRPVNTSQAPKSSVKKIQWDKRTTSFQAQPPPSTTKKWGRSNIHLEHFNYTITEKEFNTIPKYLRAGREQLADLQRCVDEILCPCLIEKYTTLNKATNDLATVHQRQLQRVFKEQESYFPGHFFITEGDIARFLNTLIDKRLRNRIQMLRQLGLIKEVRKNSIACYMWMIRVEE